MIVKSNKKTKKNSTKITNFWWSLGPKTTWLTFMKVTVKRNHWLKQETSLISCHKYNILQNQDFNLCIDGAGILPCRHSSVSVSWWSDTQGRREHFTKQLSQRLNILMLLWATNKPPVGWQSRGFKCSLWFKCSSVYCLQGQHTRNWCPVSYRVCREPAAAVCSLRSGWALTSYFCGSQKQNVLCSQDVFGQ